MEGLLRLLNPSEEDKQNEQNMTSSEKILKYSMKGTKKYGNFYKFFLDECYNALYVMWLGFSGACILIMINLVKPTCPDGCSIDDLLPTNMDDAPYCASKDEMQRLTTFQTIFSHKSDFPYSIRFGLNNADVYASFFTGMAAFLFSFSRDCIKSVCKSIHKRLNWTIVDAVTFYILPTAIYYIVNIGVLPFFAVLGPNLYSCFTQRKSKFAYLISLAFFANMFMFPAYDYAFTMNVLWYFLSIAGGYGVTFMLVPMASYCIGIAYGIYMMLFFNFLPVFLIYYGEMTVKEFFTQLFKQMSDHWAGLSILFLYFSINIAYRNLNKQIAIGAQIGSILLILYLLNIFGHAKNYTIKAINSLQNKE